MSYTVHMRCDGPLRRSKVVAAILFVLGFAGGGGGNGALAKKHTTNRGHASSISTTPECWTTGRFEKNCYHADPLNLTTTSTGILHQYEWDEMGHHVYCVPVLRARVAQIIARYTSNRLEQGHGHNVHSCAFSIRARTAFVPRRSLLIMLSCFVMSGRTACYLDRIGI